ncbi:MAG: 1-phosphofructokinase family hexose kinase [Alkalilacustris sp.]
MQHRPILTVTLNPAVDLAARVERMEPGPKLRLSEPRRDPGGGGINVARAIGRLGGRAQAFVALGGAMGAQLAWLLEAEGVGLHRFDAPGETRQSMSVLEAATGLEYRLVLPGADWPLPRARKALAAIEAAVRSAGVVVLSGSQPPGVPDDFPTRLARRLEGAGATLVVDTSGAPLDRLVDVPDPDHPPAVLRMDDVEAEEVAGCALPGPADTADFAAALVARGVAETVVIARGADGNVLVRADTRLHCRPPKVEVKSKVGAGDSFMGAFTLELAGRGDWAQALRRGTAAAAAAVMTPGTELCSAADTDRLTPESTLTPL